MRITEFSFSFLLGVILMIEEESLGNQIERSPLVNLHSFAANYGK
jgi:hypothetical protein